MAAWWGEGGGAGAGLGWAGGLVAPPWWRWLDWCVDPPLLPATLPHGTCIISLCGWTGEMPPLSPLRSMPSKQIRVSE